MNAKQTYLVKELWILAWNASAQRAHLYRKGHRARFRKHAPLSAESR